MIEELQINILQNCVESTTGIHFSLEISLNRLILHLIAQQPQGIFL